MGKGAALLEPAESGRCRRADGRLGNRSLRIIPPCESTVLFSQYEVPGEDYSRESPFLSARPAATGGWQSTAQRFSPSC